MHIFSDKTVETDLATCTKGGNDVFVCTCKKGYTTESTQCTGGEYAS